MPEVATQTETALHETVLDALTSILDSDTPDESHVVTLLIAAVIELSNRVTALELEASHHG